VSQVTVKPTMSGSPYKKPQGSSSQLTKNRLASVSNPAHTSEEVERLKVKITVFYIYMLDIIYVNLCNTKSFCLRSFYMIAVYNQV